VYLHGPAAGVLIFAPRLMKCTSMEDAQGSWHSLHGMAGGLSMEAARMAVDRDSTLVAS